VKEQAAWRSALRRNRAGEEQRDINARDIAPEALQDAGSNQVIARLSQEGTWRSCCGHPSNARYAALRKVAYCGKISDPHGEEPAKAGVSNRSRLVTAPAPMRSPSEWQEEERGHEPHLRRGAPETDMSCGTSSAAMKHWIEVMGVGPWYYMDRVRTDWFRPSRPGLRRRDEHCAGQFRRPPDRADPAAQRRALAVQEFLDAGHEGLQHISY
jgi:hypothetical protein